MGDMTDHINSYGETLENMYFEPKENKIMKLDLLVEATNAKFANKYNSGSVLSNGKWYSVRKPVKIDSFVKGALVTVEIEVNESNGKTYENVIKIVDSNLVKETKSETVSTAKTVTVNQKDVNWDKIAEGKTKSLLYSAVLQSPYLASVNDDTEFKKRSDDLVNYFMSQIFKGE